MWYWGTVYNEKKKIMNMMSGRHELALPLTLVWKRIEKKENSQSKPALLPLEIDLVSHPTHDGVVG